ncbi:Arrestin domain-containing protein 3 [Trichoplax sp. H2]|nr:Arrestin domain-containing protein 3 [Trichoplax sp. H2]|eukprot:RDD41396.1 Arrestin domain-containing protein 3 [Trichoplax sp. H2]
MSKKSKTKIQDIAIEIDENLSYVLSGQLLKGKLVINTLDPLTEIQKIVVEAHGDGYTMLRPAANAGEGNVRHGQWKEYLKCSSTVMNQVDESETLTLDSGRHELPFNFVLPYYLPSSFNTSNKNHNYIRYWIKGTVFFTKDRSATIYKSFKVREKVALGTLQMKNELKSTSTDNELVDHKEEPRSIDLTQTLCCNILRPGSVHLTFVTDRKAYCAGHSMLLTATVENLTRLRLKALKVELVQCATVIAEGNSKVIQTKCASLESDPIEAGDTLEWQNKSFHLPDDLMPTSHSSALIQTQYELVVTVVIPMAANLSFRQNVGIATVLDADDDIQSKYQQHVILQRQLSIQQQSQQRQRHNSAVTDV